MAEHQPLAKAIIAAFCNIVLPAVGMLPIQLLGCCQAIGGWHDAPQGRHIHPHSSERRLHCIVPGQGKELLRAQQPGAQVVLLHHSGAIADSLVVGNINVIIRQVHRIAPQYIKAMATHRHAPRLVAKLRRLRQHKAQLHTTLPGGLGNASRGGGQIDKLCRVAALHAHGYRQA